MRNKDKSIPPDNTNTRLPPNIFVNLPALDYNIVEDIKKNHVNISLYELTKIMGQWHILLHTLGQTSTDSVTSSIKGSSKSLDSLAFMLNVLCMEEENLLCPLFLLWFEIFNFNVHNYLVDCGASVNVMSLPIAKRINAQWSSTNP